MGTGLWLSNCSYAHYFAHIYRASNARCLTNLPGLGYVLERCGNKIVEENEECDCGSTEECEEDRCCQPDCKLKEGASCSTGLCCHNCWLWPVWYMCRVEEMNVTLQSIAQSQVSVQVILISRMETLASTKPIVSNRVVNSGICSAKIFGTWCQGCSSSVLWLIIRWLIWELWDFRASGF